MSWAQQVCCKPVFLIRISDLEQLKDWIPGGSPLITAMLLDVDNYTLLDLPAFVEGQKKTDSVTCLLLSSGLSAICQPGLFGVDMVVEYLPAGVYEEDLALVGLGSKSQLPADRRSWLVEVLQQLAVPSEVYTAYDLQEPARSQAFRQRCDQAQVLATFFSCHPQVSHSEYFGLKDNSSRKLAERIWRKGFTPYLQLRLKPSVDATLVCKKATWSPLLTSLLSLKPLPSGDMLIEVIGSESSSKRLECGTLADGLETSSEAQRTTLMACVELDQILRGTDAQKEDAL